MRADIQIAEFSWQDIVPIKNKKHLSVKKKNFWKNSFCFVCASIKIQSFYCLPNSSVWALIKSQFQYISQKGKGNSISKSLSDLSGNMPVNLPKCEQWRNTVFQVDPKLGTIDSIRFHVRITLIIPSCLKKTVELINFWFPFVRFTGVR